MSNVRRYDYFPPNEVISEIEGVVIVDLAGPAPIKGTGTGLVCCVGEFLQGVGNVNQPTRVTSDQDITDNFGGFSQYQGDQSSIGGISSAKSYDGNGRWALSGRKYASLCLVNVDQEIGTVQLSRPSNSYPVVTAANVDPFRLANGMTCAMNVDNATTYTATFAAAAASDECSNAGVWNLTGTSLGVAVDGGTAQTINFSSGFVDIGNATPTEVSAVLNANLTGIQAVVSNTSYVTMSTDKKGTGAALVFTGSAKSVLGFTNCAGTGDAADISAVTATEVIDKLNSALTSHGLAYLSGGFVAVRSNTATTSGYIQITDSSTRTVFGFDALQHQGGSGSYAELTIPAGCRVSDGGSNVFATLEDVWFDVNSLTGLGVKSNQLAIAVRPASAAVYGGATVSTGTITTMVDYYASVTVTNASGTSAWAPDTAYATAIDSLLAKSDPAKNVDIVFAARHSANITNKLKTFQLAKSAAGRGVICVTSPALGTAKATAEAAAYAINEPGMNYAYPGVQFYSTLVGANVDNTFDSWCASVLSLTPPECNPGQPTDALAALTGLEANAVSGGTVGVLTDDDYKVFKAKGIMAPIFDDDIGWSIQSGVNTSHDTAKNQVRWRRFSYFIQDSLASRAVFYVKKLGTPANVDAFDTEQRTFFSTLLSENNPAAQRIMGFSVDDKSGNTTALNALGIFVWIDKVQTVPDMADIVLQVEVGDSVVVNIQ